MKKYLLIIIASIYLTILPSCTRLYFGPSNVQKFSTVQPDELGQVVSVWEDGLRTSGKKNEFEWWYFDAKLDNGAIIVAYFWKVHFLLDQYFIGFNYRDSDGKDFFKMKYFRPKDVSFSKDSCDVQFGRNHFRGNLNSYTIRIDPEDFDGVGFEVNLSSNLKPYRPQDGIIKAGDDYFAWLAAVPNGTKSETSGADYDQYSGARAIMDIDPNITEKGAAYIAGNIQQESGWDGMRSWGEVLGDGTARNGGLVSWASWSDDPARLGAIEDHYGKKIDEISEREQLVWMIKEMKQSYPSAYTAFTNPKATDEDLKKASMAYWGYGHEGSRFRYAEKIYQEMLRVQFNEQKESAEKGAILPSSDVSIKSHQIQDSSTVVDEIEDYEQPQPIVYLTNSEISTNPLVMVKKSSNSKDFVEQYRFMSLGVA